MRRKNRLYVIVAALLLVMMGTAPDVAAQGLVCEPNRPMGEAKGIFPGRVVMARDPEIARWNGRDGHWWDDGNIDLKALERLYEKSICNVAGTKDAKAAWRKIFRYHNKAVGRGSRGYRKGERIAVKINLNNNFSVDDRDNDIDQSPQATIALLRQLVEKAGVPQNCIMVYDATLSWKKREIPSRIYTPVHSIYPEVRWMSAEGSDGVEAANWVDNAITYTNSQVTLGNSLPQGVVEADYIVNAALLKGHEITGVTLCAKNHFGSIQFPARMHGSSTVSQMKGKEGDYSAYVDLMGAPNLGRKTLLYIVDGLYGMQTNVGEPKAERDRWKMFGGQWSSCYFMSLDPVAIESVCLDFLFAEFGTKLGFSGDRRFPEGASRNCDNYLKEAAKGHNGQFGDYRPNDVKTGSLGVFEHWNNPRDRQYSRNLGRSEGIELIEINL